jgi:hypothetical protein
VVLLLALWPGWVAAADLTLFLGGVKPGELSVDGLRTPLDSSLVYGFRVATNFVPLFGMEHTLSFSSDYLFPSSRDDVTDAKGFVYSANLILSIPVGRVTPYVTGGVGLIRQYGSPDLPVGTKFAFNYGGGLKFPRLAGPLGFRLDARGYTATNVFSSSLNLLEVSGGLLLSF